MKHRVLTIILGGVILAAASSASAQNARAQANIARNNQANAMIQAAGNSLTDQISQGSNDSDDNLADLQAAALAPPEPLATTTQANVTRSSANKQTRGHQTTQKSSQDKKASTGTAKSTAKKRSSKRTSHQTQQTQQSQ